MSILASLLSMLEHHEQDDERVLFRSARDAVRLVLDNDLWIALPGGGSVRMAHGVACMERLVGHCRDVADGWCRPGWSEPADYSPAAPTAPIVDPSPAMDAVYVGGAGAGSCVIDREGNEIPMFDWDGNPLTVALRE